MRLPLSAAATLLVAATLALPAPALPAPAAARPNSPPARPPAPAATGPAPIAVAPTTGAGAHGAPPAPGSPGGLVDGGGSATGDPLVTNGLGSAACRSPRLRRQLSVAAQDNCGVSGVAEAPAPVSDYGFDVHIDTGFAGISGNVLESAVQDLVLTPAWTALVWLIHALIVALEWCYSIDLLDGANMGAIAGALHAAQRTFTQPWLALMLALAAIGAAYHGLVRRRVAETLAEALLMVAMMAAGLWMIANPAGSVGELSRIVNDASLGTLGAVAAGDPNHAEQTFTDGLGAVFDGAVGGPWCYLEFGDVNWCRDPARIDPALRAAALRIAALDSASGSCGPPTVGGIVACAPPGSPLQRLLIQRAQMLRRARSNGALFLAFPANGPDRNSITTDGSLLRTLCGADSLGACRAPTAAQAEFRDAGGTWPRAGGLLLIGIGAIGMLALLAFIALRLLGAAVLALVYLLVAPVAVLAPTLGEGGRRAFRAWAARLLGALVAKLIYSVFLGVVLLALRVLAGLGSLGWWTQWLLVAACWWVVFHHRHQVLEFVTLGNRDTAREGLRLSGGLLVARQLGRAVRPHGRAPSALRTLAERARSLPERPARSGRRLRRAGAGRDQRGAADRGARLTLADQLARSLEPDDGDAAGALVRANQLETQLALGRDRAARLRAEGARANAAGDARRAASLDARLERVAATIAAGETSVRRARELAPPSTPERGGGGARLAADAEARRARLLDSQVALRRGVPPGPRADPAAYRNYPLLAGLAGLGQARYERLEPGAQRRARLTIDRELARRAEANRRLAVDGPPRGRSAIAIVRRVRPHLARRSAVAERRARQFGSVRGESDEWDA